MAAGVRSVWDELAEVRETANTALRLIEKHAASCEVQQRATIESLAQINRTIRWLMWLVVVAFLIGIAPERIPTLLKVLDHL